jgi:hypothetical protein
MAHTVGDCINSVLAKGLCIDLIDRVSAEALRAHEMIRDHARLDGKRARELEGQARFRMAEKGFQEVCQLHGGRLLEGGVIPYTDLKIFQPFMRFEKDKQGVILGLAMMPEPRTVPLKNRSRLAAVSLNYQLSPRFDFDGSGPKVGDVFAAFLCSRDREKAGQIEEIAIGVINSEYNSFLFYEPLNKFMARYADEVLEKPTVPETDVKLPIVMLKKTIIPFVPPEPPTREECEDTGSS